MDRQAAACAEEQTISPIGGPVTPLSRIVPIKKRRPDQPAPRKPAPGDSKPKPA